MKPILRSEWISYIRGNLIALFLSLTVWLLLTSGWWYVIIDVLPIIYAFALSPVFALAKDIRCGFQAFEMTACRHHTRVFSRYLILAGYGLAAGLIILMISHDLLTALGAVLCTMMIPALSLCVYFLKRPSAGAVYAAAGISCVTALPPALILRERVISLQIAMQNSSPAVEPFHSEISFAVPLAVILLSFLSVYVIIQRD